MTIMIQAKQRLTEFPAWTALETHYRKIKDLHLRKMFADDPDVYVVDPRSIELDLRPALREQWLLAVPSFVQCREDCKGLCPTCGTDLNAGECECAPATDSRWDTLRKVRGQSK